MKQAEATGFVVLGEPLFFGPNSQRVNDLALRRDWLPCGPFELA
jgi:hypothetical protein